MRGEGEKEEHGNRSLAVTKAKEQGHRMWWLCYGRVVDFTIDTPSTCVKLS